MAIVFPSLVPDFIRSMDSPVYSPDVNSYNSGEEFRFPTQFFGSNLVLSFEYVNRKGDYLLTLFDFLREVRGAKEFVLPYEVWKHKNGFYLGVLNAMRRGKFMIVNDINIKSVRKNIYSFSLDLVSVLSNSNEVFSDYQEELRLVVRLPDSDGVLGEPSFYSFLNSDPNSFFSWNFFADGLVNKFKVWINENGVETVLGEFFNSSSSSFPVVEVRVV